MTSGNRNAPPEQGSWNVPGSAPYAPPAETHGAGLRRGRPGVAALVAVLVELVVIAAACNQSVSKHAQHYFVDHETSFLGRAVGSVLQFSWRVKPLSGDNHDGFHVFYSELAAIVVFVVVSALLTLVVVRGPVTFWRAFFGVWTAVFAAACLARVAGAFVTKPLAGHTDRASFAVFDTVTGLTTFFAVVVGLLTALIAGSVAVATRRTLDAPAPVAPPAEAPYVPESPPPFYGSQPVRPQPGVDPRAEHETTALPSMSKDAGRHSTQQLPEVPEENDGRTTQIPRFDPRGGQNWTPPEGDGGATQALPNAPEDRPR